MNIAFITGRSPQLAQKEIEAAATILPFQWSLSILQPGVVMLKPESGKLSEYAGENSLWSEEHQNLMTCLNKLQNRLGGTLKIVLLLKEVSRQELEKEVTALIAKQATGRVVFGLSCYGGGVDSFKTGLSIKKLLKKEGFSVRVVPAKEGNALSTAQISHNKLGTEADSLEVAVIKSDSGYQVGLTVASQDIESYRKRDFSIPVPDPVSGMLSPKVAQMMINLAVGSGNPLVYDAFCGNGRIVEEARVMGFRSMGSDLLQKQVDASRTNLTWIAKEYNLELEQNVEQLIWRHDATKSQVELKFSEPFVIVSEPYLGKPLRQPLTPQEEVPWLKELQELYMGFFQVWAHAKQKPKSMIIVFPKAVCSGTSSELSLFNSLVDRLKKLGYSISQMSEYGRTDALVKREIIQLRIF